MKSKFILSLVVVALLSCNDNYKNTKQNQQANTILLKSLDNNQEQEIFSIKDTMKIIQILILQEQVVKQAYVNNEHEYQYMLKTLAENESAYQNVYHEEWITTIQRPRDPKKRKKH